MEEVFKTFVDKFGNLPPILAFVVMVLLIVSYFFKDAISNKIKEYKLQRNGGGECENDLYRFEDLHSHDVFNVIFEVKSLVKFHQFTGDEVKTKVFHDFLNIMLEEIHQNMKKLIVMIAVQHKNGEVSRDELKQIIRKVLNTIVDNYCLKGERHLIDKGLTKKDAAYVVELFEKWRNETRASINSRIDAIFASSFHTTNFHRTLAVYELISVSVSLIPKDGIRSFESMNGKFKTIQYD
jgi:hypothetical protein